MVIEVKLVEFSDIEGLREFYRGDVDCQIVHDSVMPRRLADSYVVLCEGEIAAYGGVWTKYFPRRVVEFYSLERFRGLETELFQRFILSTGAKAIEAQTNMPRMWQLLKEFGGDVSEEKILFQEGGSTALGSRGGLFRRRGAGEEGPEGEWVVEVSGEIVAAGGVLTHYNPPYGDLYMEVRAAARGQGLGSYIVQELKGVCHQSGLVPAARCDPDNIASHRTLERGGMVECGRLCAARIRL